MSFEMWKILESKRAMRQKLAALPVAEKLKLLDALRERQLAIRGRSECSGNLGEAPLKAVKVERSGSR